MLMLKNIFIAPKLLVFAVACHLCIELIKKNGKEWLKNTIRGQRPETRGPIPQKQKLVSSGKLPFSRQLFNAVPFTHQLLKFPFNMGKKTLVLPSSPVPKGENSRISRGIPPLIAEQNAACKHLLLLQYDFDGESPKFMTNQNQQHRSVKNIR